MNRIDRLNAILIQLQTKRKIKAQEIADKFGISLRTVYRDVKALEEAGVPVIGEAGSGYQLMEGYRLPPVQFCREEAAALIESTRPQITATTTVVPEPGDPGPPARRGEDGRITVTTTVSPEEWEQMQQ